MANDRLSLHTILTNISGVKKAYFQPPSSKILEYPCIVYERSDVDTIFANNKSYRHKNRYLIKIIDSDPDSLIPDQVAKLPMCSFAQHYTSDNLNHTAYNLYY